MSHWFKSNIVSKTLSRIVCIYKSKRTKLMLIIHMINITVQWNSDDWLPCYPYTVFYAFCETFFPLPTCVHFIWYHVDIGEKNDGWLRYFLQNVREWVWLLLVLSLDFNNMRVMYSIHSYWLHAFINSQRNHEAVLQNFPFKIA